jgi:hypothetical protein
MTVARNSMLAGVIVGLAALAACQSAGPGGSPIAPSGVDGEWMSADGVAISSLNGGKFSSRIVATGETVTTGTYTMRDARTIDLDFFSVKSQQNTKATCMLVSSNQMNCTLAAGTNFTLVRRA